MAIVRIQMPTVNSTPTTRPKQCPRCGGEILQRWGKVAKPVHDTEFDVVVAYRFRCTQCKATFRHYPDGVDRADLTLRLRCLAALAWGMGLSLRGVGIIFCAFGSRAGISRMSVWRAVQQTAQSLRSKANATQGKHNVRVLGVDGAWIRLKGQTTGVMVMVAVDMGDGQLVSMEVVDEHDPQAVCKWLKPLVTEFGVEVIVTDDLVTYNTIEEELKVKRQVCYFHMRRWVGKAPLDLEKQIKESYPGWEWVVEEVRLLVEELPPKGDEELLELWQKVNKEAGNRAQKEEATALQKLAGLIVGLMENWRRYRLYQTDRGVKLGVPATNNLTEQMIGNGKIRSRTVRGYKSEGGALAAFAVCAARFA
jgi:transposase-like protein